MEFVSATVPDSPLKRRFRLPGLAYLAVLFLLLCVAPLAFTGTGDQGQVATVGPQTSLLIIPLLAAVFIARAGTTVDADGLRIRALFGTRRLGWGQLRGLSVTGHNVYAVALDGSVRLPCVRIADLAALSKASGGRLPAVAEPTPKYAPPARRRR